MSSVENSKCEFGILPIENSSSGSINDVLDTIQNTKASIVGEIFVPIDHSILGVEKTDLSQITDIYSHPQPLTQCSMWIEKMLPNVKVHYTSATTEAMEIVAKMNDPHHVAIGSFMAADLYNLTPIADHISNNPNNFTRFIAISMTAVNVPETIAAKTSIAFSVQKYQPGSLIKVLNVFSERNINVTKLISRPRIDSNKDVWEEIFFADVQANVNDSAMLEILDSIKPYTNFMKVLGCYASSEIQKKD